MYIDIYHSVAVNEASMLLILTVIDYDAAVIQTTAH